MSPIWPPLPRPPNHATGPFGGVPLQLEESRLCLVITTYLGRSVVQGQLLFFGVGFGVGVTKNPRVGFGTGLGFDTFYSVISSNARV